MGPWRNSTGNPSASSADSEAHRAAEDAELIARIAHGSERAFGELVRRHARYLYGIARSLTDNEADAEDVLQETFIAALSARFRGEAKVRTWLVSILVRRAALLRRGPARPRPVGADETIQDRRPSEIAGAEAKLDLAAMLELLSPEHREVIVLREIEQMSYEEIASVLGVPRGTVESRLHRARVELREKFKGYL